MRILVGMSGGLDSTYAAMKLKSEGHNVEGAVLLMHEFTDIAAARSAADSIGIKLHTVDCRDAFSTVRENFVSEYLKGRTPNPCIICNPAVKFRYLADFAREHGFDRIATGHYAEIVRIVHENHTVYALKSAKDTKKDQTYMLCRLPQDILSMLVLPLADEVKTDIRTDAKDKGIDAADKKDSQEICFIPDGDYASYIEHRAGAVPCGRFVDTEGNTLGTHKGIIRYTIGQRKGLGISLGGRAFVNEINATDNTVMLAPSPKLTDTLYIDDIVYSGYPEPSDSEQLDVQVKLRYSSALQNARLVLKKGERGQLLLDTPAGSVTPGQSAVAYKDGVVLLSGFISLD